MKGIGDETNSKNMFEKSSCGTRIRGHVQNVGEYFEDSDAKPKNTVRNSLMTDAYHNTYYEHMYYTAVVYK